MKQICFILGLLFLFISNSFSNETHFPNPDYQPAWCTYSGKLNFGNISAVDGEDEVAVFVKNNIGNEICIGSCIFGKVLSGYYYLNVYGDDPRTNTKEGAFEKEKLIFKVWDKSANQEYVICQMSTREYSNTMAIPDIPPIYEESKHFAELNLYVYKNNYIYGDVNYNCRLDLRDAIQILLKISNY